MGNKSNKAVNKPKFTAEILSDSQAARWVVGNEIQVSHASTGFEYVDGQIAEIKKEYIYVRFNLNGEHSSTVKKFEKTCLETAGNDFNDSKPRCPRMKFKTYHFDIEGNTFTGELLKTDKVNDVVTLLYNVPKDIKKLPLYNTMGPGRLHVHLLRSYYKNKSIEVGNYLKITERRLDGYDKMMRAEEYLRSVGKLDGILNGGAIDDEVRSVLDAATVAAFEEWLVIGRDQQAPSEHKLEMDAMEAKIKSIIGEPEWLREVRAHRAANPRRLGNMAMSDSFWQGFFTSMLMLLGTFVVYHLILHKPAASRRKTYIQKKRSTFFKGRASDIKSRHSVPEAKGVFSQVIRRQLSKLDEN